MLIHRIWTSVLAAALIVNGSLVLAQTDTSDLKCIGKNNDPKNDFYARRLNDMVQYVDRAPARLAELKKKKASVENRLKELKTRVIPSLKKHIEGDRQGTMFLEMEAAEINVEKSDRTASTARQSSEATALKTLNAEKLRLKTELSTLNEREGSAVLAFDQTSLAITEKEMEVKQQYENEENAVRTRFNTQRTPLLRSSQTRREDLDRIEDSENQALTVVDKNRQTELDKYQKQRSSLETKRAQELAQYTAKIQANTEALRSAEENFKTQNDKARATFESAQSKSRSIENKRLDRVQGQLTSALARNQREAESLEKELQEIVVGKSTADANGRPEKNLELHGIEQIEQHVGKIEKYTADGHPLFDTSGDFEMIKRWWREQGRKNHFEKLETEAQAAPDCKDCKIKALPLPKYAPEISKQCVVKTVQHLSADTPQYKCDTNDANGTPTQDSCITDDLADYTQWSVNNAIRCLSPKIAGEQIDPNIIALKINRESNFKHDHCNKGGCGLLQTTTCARDEMMGCSPSPHCCAAGDYACRSRANCGMRASGRDFLAHQLAANAKILEKFTPENNPCEPYKKFINYDKESKSDATLEPRRLFDVGFEKKCQVLSMEQGIHRNILNGIGLYLFYRDHGAGSASELLKTKLGLNPDNSDFGKIRDYFALSMYGRNGNSGAETSFTNRIAKFKAKMSDGKLTFEEFKGIIDGAIPYLREINKSAVISYSDIGGGTPQCGQQ